MEQKQLDDLEDSFFGEEFIEDLEDLPPVTPAKSQEIKIEKIEPRENDQELRLRGHKKPSPLPLKKSAVKKSEKSTPVKAKEAVEEKHAAEKVSELKAEKKSETSAPAKKETATVTIKPAKTSPVSETKATVETSSPVNPWEDDDKGSKVFKETSTWKVLTGVAVVLLVLSLFTQGFTFTDKNAATGAVVVTLPEAEQKVLTYVNTKLLQAPFQAEVQSSEELDTLYRVTLSVADQVVDSYVTKDGKLFFPQGLEMDKPVPGTEQKLSETDKPVAVETTPDVKVEETSEPKPELEVPTEPTEVKEPEQVAEPAAGKTVKLTLNAKKWIFNPNVLRVEKGTKVALTIVPTGLDFTFAVPALGVEQTVSGTTEVVFTADKSGTFDFTCGSCEDWRGMRGNLLVESST